MTDMKYAIFDRKVGEGMPAIELENGLRFVVDSISFPDEIQSDDGFGTLSFEYTLLCDPAFPQEEYETMIGDWISFVLNAAVEDDTLDKLLGT